MKSPIAFIAGLSVRARLGLLAGFLLLGQAAISRMQYVTIQRYKVGGELYAHLKAQTDSIDLLSAALADVHRLDAAVRSLGQRPPPEEVGHARARAVEVGNRVAARLEQVRALQAGEGGGDPARELAASWESVHAPLLGRLSAGAGLDGRDLAVFLDGPRRERHARVVAQLEAALTALRQKALQIERETESGVRRAVTTRLTMGVVFFVTLWTLFILIARSILQPLSSLVHVAERVSQGDLSVEPPPRSSGELGRVAEGLGRMVLALRGMVDALARSAADVGDAAARLRAAATEQLSGTQRQVATLRQTQAVAEALRRSSRAAAERAERLRRTADAATGVGRAGAASLEASREGIESIKTGIDEIGERIDSLSARAQSLGRVARAMKDITDQTNMLALNAAMEAMRAGVHGKAFAVVAREMRSLTDRAAGSAEDIARELDGTTEALRQAVAATGRGRTGMNVGLSEIEAGARTLQRLSEMVKEGAGEVGEIANAVDQQDEGIDQVFGALTQLTATLEQSAGNVARIRESIDLLETAAARVREAAGTFRA